jgi:maltokinase
MSVPVPEPERIAELVADWLPGQRWYAGKGRTLRSAEAQRLGTLTEEPHPSAIWLIRVAYADGGREVYQVPLVARPEATDWLTHVLVGVTDADGGHRRWWYDALHDKEVTSAWLRHIEADREEGALRFRRGPGVESLPIGANSLVMTAEQSNTSLVFGDAAILKVFRKVSPGVNPDIEVHEALGRLPGGDRHIARLLGHVQALWTEPDEHHPPGPAAVGSLAMLQEFFRTATDGWDLAKISVRDLYAEADLHPDEVGGDFAGEAQRLGAATGEIHQDLARALPTGVLDRDDVARLAEAMRGRLENAVASVPELADFAPRLRATYDALEKHEASVPVQRIHGDYHLGQVLRTSRRWVVLDFEGEPAKPLSERVALDSPLRDVAGMVRSFEYAARHLLADHPHEPHLAHRADEWAARNRTAFCDGYAEVTGHDPREDALLLRAYEADKAVYEAVYEARNRPSWLGIPLASLARLTEGMTG